MIHIIAIPPGDFSQLMNRNLWLHTLPDFTTFQLAVNNLKKWEAWDAVPPSVRKHLEAADPKHETVKAKAFEKMDFRVFGVMPPHMGMIPATMNTAKELGYTPVILAQGLRGEASQAGIVVATIARTIEMTGQPLKPPCALFTSGELLVTVGQEKGIGGRNQEFILSAAQRISGSESIVMGAADSDGTDGPGTQFVEEGADIPCLGGGIVDGETIEEAKNAGIDIREELRRHNATVPLWNLKSGIVISKSISINDLSVTLINKRH
jgi:glycerate-2-kinase